MISFRFRETQWNDLPSIMKVYNSNPDFLRHHLGFDTAYAQFLSDDIREMKRCGFSSNVILDSSTGQVIGVLDYKAGGIVYLSLIMLDKHFQGKGNGAAAFRQFENEMRLSHAHSIRIDVVNDYPSNLVPFWTKQGFHPKEEVPLKWGIKDSRALIMTKELTDRT